MADLSTPGDVQLFEGRLFVHLADIDGRTVYAHGLVVCPAHLQDQEQALAEIDRIFRSVVRDHGDDWSYDDVIAALERAASCTAAPPTGSRTRPSSTSPRMLRPTIVRERLTGKSQRP